MYDRIKDILKHFAGDNLIEGEEYYSDEFLCASDLITSTVFECIKCDVKGVDIDFMRGILYTAFSNLVFDLKKTDEEFSECAKELKSLYKEEKKNYTELKTK